MIRHPRRPDDSDRLGARIAIAKAEASLAVAEARTEIVSELTSKLRIEGSENHFIQRLNMHKNKDEYDI